MDLLGDMYGPPALTATPVRIKKIGSREEVWTGQAQCTKGGLTRSDLAQKVVKTDPATGKQYTRIVSKRASESARRLGHLEGYLRPKQNLPDSKE